MPSSLGVVGAGDGGVDASAGDGVAGGLLWLGGSSERNSGGFTRVSSGCAASGDGDAGRGSHGGNAATVSSGRSGASSGSKLASRRKSCSADRTRASTSGHDYGTSKTASGEHQRDQMLAVTFHEWCAVVRQTQPRSWLGPA